MCDMCMLFGRVVFKCYGGKMYVIIKGNLCLWMIFSGIKYGVCNVKVIGFGIGKYGVMVFVKGGMIVICVFLIVYNVVDYFM